MTMTNDQLEQKLGQVLETLNTKADVDLGNTIYKTIASSTANNIVHFPDYSQYIDQKSLVGVEITAPDNGWIWCLGTHVASTFTPRLIINGVQFAFYNNSANNALSYIFIPVAKDSVYKAEGTISELKFFKCLN